MIEPVQSLADPRVALYRNLKDRELDRSGKWFIAEGEYIVRRLLASDFPIESVFLTERRANEIAPLVPPDVPVYVAPTDVMNGVLGMKFHSGILACGRRKPRQSIDAIPRDKPDLLLVICQDISNVENIGSLIRLAAGFGADAMVLGERCHDPFWRQSVRVSMGTIFKLPIVQSDDLVRDMARLRNEWGVQIAATVLAPDAEPISAVRRSARFAIVLGSESQGLDDATVAACDRCITIPMSHGTDSLNVTMAAGIFLYHFTQGAGTGSSPSCRVPATPPQESGGGEARQGRQ